MKSIILGLVSMISISAFGFEDVGFSGKPVVGVGSMQQNGLYGVLKVYALEIGNPKDSIKAGALGFGLIVLGKQKGLVFSPLIINVDHVGIGFDYTIKSGGGIAGLSLNYSF
jgi:hypothetical protein